MFVWKRLVFFLAALAAFVTGLEGGNKAFFPFEYRPVRLGNGFKAYLIKTDAPRQIAYVTVVRSGSRDEQEKGRSGYAHFFEHMMFRGTQRYPRYDEIIGEMGALSNAATSDDFTQFFVVASSDELERVVDLESDRFMNLSYTESQFRTEAGAILGEFSQTQNNPLNLLYEKIQDTAFLRHPYKHLTIGTEEDVRRMPEGYAYSLDFYRNHYRPENCVLLLAGDFDFDTAESLIRKYYAPWKPGYRETVIQPEPKQESPRRAAVAYAGRSMPMLAVDYRGPAWSATDKTAVAAEVLGRAAFGPRSALYKRIVIRDRKARALTVDFGLRRDPSLLEVMALVADPSDLAAVEGAIGDTVEEFRKELCDARLVEDVKKAMKYEFLMSMETPLGVCFALRPVATFTGGIEAIEDYAETLESVAPEDVRAAAVEYLVKNGRTTITLMPDGGSEQ